MYFPLELDVILSLHISIKWSHRHVQSINLMWRILGDHISRWLISKKKITRLRNTIQLSILTFDIIFNYLNDSQSTKPETHLHFSVWRSGIDSIFLSFSLYGLYINSTCTFVVVSKFYLKRTFTYMSQLIKSCFLLLNHFEIIIMSLSLIKNLIDEGAIAH